MLPSRDWLTAFHCLFSIIPDEPPRTLIPHALVPSLRSWKEDTPRVLYNECRHVHGEINWAGVYALRVTLLACAQAIKSGRNDSVESLPKTSKLMLVLVPLESPLDNTVDDYLRDYWPTHDMNGTVLPVQRAELADKTAFRLTIYTTIQWAYYSQWCGHLLPTSSDLEDSMINKRILTFHATPGEIGWANDVGFDVHPLALSYTEAH
ncbi:hypothetical protein JCM10296v2_005772 [Rhodotorula toruloides]